MPTTIDRPSPASRASSVTPAGRLRATMAAARVAFTWLGVRKSLSPEQKEQAADTFGASGEFMSAGKKLLDTKHPAFKAVSSLKSQMVSYWRALSLPFPEPGIRLIRQEDVAGFNEKMDAFRFELDQAVTALDERYLELQTAARARLGRLFNASDYPASLSGLFDVCWDYPSVEPPDYLRQLNPRLYEQESQRVAARFNEAVELAEQAFSEELSKMVSHLTERLSGQEDGKPKVFRDTAVDNLHDFFERFKYLNVRSSAQLDDLVERAQRIVSGVLPQTLRDNRLLRQQTAAQLAGVQSVLDGLLVDKPRRNILRRPK